MRGLRAIGCGCLIVLLTWLFVEVVWYDHRLAFRDAAHFYGPLSRLVQAEWAAGRIPLWNPYVGIGAPLAASPTAAAFYPAQLLAALPLSPGHIELCYVLIHLLLCAGGTYVLARDLGTSVTASLLAAITYACSGSVLFQYCNVVFLVGAAWLPVALWATRRVVHRRQLKYAFTLGAVLALMTLGGDPQMAYHAGLFAAAYVIVQTCTSLRERRQRRLECGADMSLGHVGPLRLFAAAAATALVLAAVQWMPSVELARLSTRGVPEYPRNVYQLCASWFGSEPTIGTGGASGTLFQRPANPEENEGAVSVTTSTYAALFGRSDLGDAHQRQTYRFSVGPWHLLEFWFPNFSGQLFPTNQRWIRMLAAEGRTWVPSLYLGLIPALLALACIGRGADRQTRRLLWFTLFCLLAASGQYAPAWLAREAVSLFGVDADRLVVGDALGGLYWMMVNLLPGYETFRYPGKWLVPASLGIALLAAKGWDRQDIAYWLRALRLGKCVLLTSLVLCGVVGTLCMVAPHCFSSGPSDLVFGPLDVDGVWRGLLQSSIHSAVVAALFVWIIGKIGRCTRSGLPQADNMADSLSHGSTTRSPSRHVYAVAVLVITTLDLAIAQKPLVGTAPDAIWQTSSVMASEVRTHSEVDGKAIGVPPRISRASAWRPARWSREIDRDRLQDVVQWDRDTLYPLYQLDERINVVNDTGTMQLADFFAFHAIAAPMTHQQLSRLILGDKTGLDALSVECFVTSPEGVTRPDSVFSGWFSSTAEPLPPLVSRGGSYSGIRLRKYAESQLWSSSHQHCPRVWISHQWDERTFSHPASFAELRRRTASVLYDGHERRNFRTHPVVESESPLPLPPPALPDEQLASEVCTIVHYDPQRVEIEATLHAPGLVVLADQFYPGWNARVTTAGEDDETQLLDIVRVNRVLRGVWLPAGEHRLEFYYRPNSVMLGAIVSAVGWLAMLATVGVVLLRRQTRQA